MCGIAGIFNFNNQIVNIDNINSMIAAQHHRGPDGNGIWANDDKNLILGHNRLSIIDLSESASQPMHYADRFVITYNGELYNYLILKNELKQKGHQFKTNSDTEVLIALYAEYGTECLKKMDGMFAFAIWDKIEKKIFCARDRFGEKPFHYYYSQQEKKFIFASEIKTLFASNEVKKSVNHKMVYHFLANELVENPLDFTETFFENVIRLMPSHFILIGENGDLKIEKYWSLDYNKNPNINSSNQEEVYEWFKSSFTDSVNTRMQADVPIGTSLSGGLDSSTISCIINNLKKDSQVQKTFSARFYDEKLDEGKYIHIVKNEINIDGKEVWVDETNLLEKTLKVLKNQDEPFTGTSAIAQYEVMKLASENNVKVLLDGQGADELLAGYSHFYPVYFRQLFLINSKFLKSELEGYKNIMGDDFEFDLLFMINARFHPIIKTISDFKRNYLGAGYNKFLNTDFVHQNNNHSKESLFKFFDNFPEAQHHFLTQYGLHKLLRHSDRNSMANSIEVRLPFVNHHMIEKLMKLPSEFFIKDGWTKYILRRSFADIVPSEVIWRKTKLGFQPPEKTWMESNSIKPIMQQAHDWLYNNGITNKLASDENKWKYLMIYLFLNH
jgi:asparagine synthase (glutamine-hydrolysing)